MSRSSEKHDRETVPREVRSKLRRNCGAARASARGLYQRGRGEGRTRDRVEGQIPRAPPPVPGGNMRDPPVPELKYHMEHSAMEG